MAVTCRPDGRELHHQRASVGPMLLILTLEAKQRFSQTFERSGAALLAASNPLGSVCASRAGMLRYPLRTPLEKSVTVSECLRTRLQPRTEATDWNRLFGLR